MGRQHPLDVFRSSRDGFDKASKRRRVVGKVIASSVKVKSALAGLFDRWGWQGETGRDFSFDLRRRATQDGGLSRVCRMARWSHSEPGLACESLDLGRSIVRFRTWQQEALCRSAEGRWCDAYHVLWRHRHAVGRGAGARVQAVSGWVMAWQNCPP